jgi:hypothetical protein
LKNKFRYRDLRGFKLTADGFATRHFRLYHHHHQGSSPAAAHAAQRVVCIHFPFILMMIISIATDCNLYVRIF